ncbi:MAG: hypothetical protein SOZ80_04855 [Prevotella sp.]|uniref:hypothetical protein n=1 Tax=Prevotella sp. TaxID=59823 RepID=UPI002A7EA6C1|nr:hypothetical protein [Prevotella sp.]MDY4020089.1 hypothetical protein [Prevotella sp.]
MHSNIFQISTEPIEKKRYCNPDDIDGGDMVSLDYAYDTKTEERTALIRSLVENILPQGMFTLNPDTETLTYNGGMAEWKKKYVADIQRHAMEVDEQNVMKWIGKAYHLQIAIANPLDTACLFITEEYAPAEHSRELMLMIDRLQEGEQLYIGAILGYHF